MGFQSFAPVSMAKTPDLIGAQSKDDVLDESIRRNNLKNTSQLLRDGVSLYGMSQDPDSWLGEMMGAGSAGEGTWTDQVVGVDAGLPAVGATDGLNSAVMSEALRGGAPEALGAATSGLNTGTTAAALAPELGTLGLGEALGATAGFNEAGTLAALAAPEAAAGAAAAGAGGAGLMSVLGPAGLALSLGSLLGLFG